MTGPILIIDDDRATDEVVCAALTKAGVAVDTVTNGFSAIEMLRERRYTAVVLDLMIRRGLNGYAVLNFIELEQPELLETLYLLTGMPEQTVRRTAPAIYPRLFRKPEDAMKLAGVLLAIAGSLRVDQRSGPHTARFEPAGESPQEFRPIR